MGGALDDVLSGGVREELLSHAHPRRFAHGEVIYHQGDPGDALYVLQRGHVAVRVCTPDGGEATVAVLGPPEEFGELALLLEDHRHTATVVALDEVEALTVARSEVDRLRAVHPELTDLLLHVMARRLSRLTELFTEALFLDAGHRVARRLIEVARLYANDVQHPLPLTQDDVAAMSGVSRPTANRALQRLARRGAIELGRRHIEIRDPGLLTRAAGWRPGG